MDSATKKMDTGVMLLVLAWIVTDTWLPATVTSSLKGTYELQCRPTQKLI